MKLKLSALALVLAIVPSVAYAKPHRQITDEQLQDCLEVDFDPDGTQWCVKSGKGMSKAQIDEWYVEYGKILDAQYNSRQAAIETPNLENCTRVIDGAEFYGKWIDGAKPSEDDCRPFAAQAQAAIDSKKAAIAAHIHHAKNTEIMKQCDRMSDVPAIDWASVAALRHITVDLNDCAKASAGLAAELRK